MEESRKRHIILVHGAGHGAWCWYKVATLLGSAGHHVTVPDLAASGTDTRKAGELSNFAEYSQPLLEIMDSLPPGERVVLVGHSLGGINIAVVMERFPEKVALAVFVTAYMPDCRQSVRYLMEQYYQRNPPTYNQMDNVIEGDPEAMVFTSVKFGPQFLASRLYNLCSPEVRTLAYALVRPAPAALAEYHSGARSFSRDRYGSVPSVYIICREDKQFPESYQRWMTQNRPLKEVVEIEGADHMVMLSEPQQFCQSLLRVVDDIA